MTDVQRPRTDNTNAQHSLMMFDRRQQDLQSTSMKSQIAPKKGTDAKVSVLGIKLRREFKLFSKAQAVIRSSNVPISASKMESEEKPVFVFDSDLKKQLIEVEFDL